MGRSVPVVRTLGIVAEHAGRRWIEELPDDLSAQGRLLDGLLEVCERDAALSWLVIGCSLARAAADHLSDLDLAMGVEGDEPATAADRVRQAVVGLADPVESLIHRLPGVAVDHERLFVQFEDRTQIDLVVVPAAASSLSAQTVVLYDPDGRVNVADRLPSVTSATQREWAFLACCALVDVGKYLRRESVWEAFGRLNAARDELWKLVAVTLGVPDAQYGITSALDFAADRVPVAMASTIASLGLTSIATAARNLAALLAEIGRRLPSEAQAVFPARMLDYVTADLASLPFAAIRADRGQDNACPTER